MNVELSKSEKEERQNRYWMKGVEGRCRMCNEERETIDHIRMNVAK
jgi:hypothetical protein